MIVRFSAHIAGPSPLPADTERLSGIRLASAGYRSACFVLCILAWLLAGDPATAQLSPGKLHHSHAHLEGLKNCTSCHELGEQLSARKCLDCHVLLAERIDAGEGLHSRSDQEDCAVCHIEHHGEDFALIHWPDGRDAFAHAQTGYVLEGKHGGVACRDCHRGRNIPDPEPLLARGKVLQHTYLGLSRDCLACHGDRHRGQFGTTCSDCHSLEGWSPATGFSHDRARFALTGRHRTVACASCHRRANAEDESGRVVYRGIAHERCTDCHRDVHAGRFGAACTECHNTVSWESTSPAAFDHTRTAFPLRGRHVELACKSCHRPGAPKAPLVHARCDDCHPDFHRGALAGRAEWTACESCHDESGFSPARFTLEQHQATRYPLRGAHLAVPCRSCHQPAEAGTNTATLRLVYDSTRCADCHTNPHRGEVDTYLAEGSCEACHDMARWSNLSFDHSRTEFALHGRHRQIACRGCHGRETAGGGAESLQLRGITRTCEQCHDDPHRGQFARAAASSLDPAVTTDCGRCHTPIDWLAEKFDHDRDSRFPLGGGHEDVPCQNCHLPEQQAGKEFVPYRPLGSACADCHDAAIIRTDQTIRPDETIRTMETGETVETSERIDSSGRSR